MLDIKQFKQIITSIDNNNLTLVLVKQINLVDVQLESKLFDLATKARIPFFIVSTGDPLDNGWVYFFENNNKIFVKKVELELVVNNFNFNIQMPSIPQMAKNIIDQTANTIKTAVTTGHIFTPFEDLQNRLKVCSKCEFLIEKRCQKCGCYMEYKAKLISASCPIIGKWSALKDKYIHEIQRI